MSMMTSNPRSLLPVALAFVAMLPVAAGQDQNPQAEQGCVETSPCLLVLDVDADGFVDDPQGMLEQSVGDWFVLSVMNHDTAPHQVTLAGHGVDLQVPAEGLAESPAFQVTQAGEYALTDRPSGDAVTLLVRDYDFVAREDVLGADGPDPQRQPIATKDAAAGALVAVLAFVLVAAAVARRRL